MENNVLRIASWNCRNGFDGEKPQAIKKYDADILVIPECRKMDMENSGYDEKHHDWWGDHKEATDNSGNVNKKKDLGVGVFWKDRVTITQLPQWKETLCKNSDFRYLIPYKVDGNFGSFTLIAVWTKDICKTDTTDRLQYVQKAHAAVEHYKSNGLLDDRVIFIGDFNTGSIQGASNAHRYEELNLAFAEKDFKNCADRQEWVPTFFRGANSWLDDHCFASIDLQVISFGIGNYDYWRKYSDHCPIIVDFAL